jgi:hypothetical protein
MVHQALCSAFPATQPSPVHADTESLAVQLRSWLDSHGLLAFEEVRQLDAVGRIPLQAAVVYPGCRTPDEAQLCCAWLAWAQAFDDRFDRTPLSADPAAARLVVDRCLRVTAQARTGRAAPAEEPDPFGEAFADLVTWAGRPMGPAWREHFLADLDEWLRSYVAETCHRAEGYVLAPADLIAHKRRCMADTVNCDLFERVATGELSPLARQILRPLVDVGMDILGAVNDIVSLNRERARRDSHNLVISLACHQGMTEEAAVEEIRRLVSAWSAELARLRDALPADPALHAEQQIIADWAHYRCAFVRGYHDWTLQTGRYQT